MPLAAFEPGKEMAIANFFLAIFCLFTVALPLLLITRGDKTEANRHFLAAVVNPWSEVVKEAELEPILVSEITSTVKIGPNIELDSEQNIGLITEPEEIISFEINGCDELNESSKQPSEIDDELIAA